MLADHGWAIKPCLLQSTIGECCARTCQLFLLGMDWMPSHSRSRMWIVLQRSDSSGVTLRGTIGVCRLDAVCGQLCRRSGSSNLNLIAERHS